MRSVDNWCGVERSPTDTDRPPAVAGQCKQRPGATGLRQVRDRHPSADAIPGAEKARRNEVDLLELRAGQEWSRPLRGSPREVTYASFQVYASQTTIIEVGGARLGVTASASNGYLQLMYDDSASGALQWRGLGVIMPAEPHGGRMLAPLPVLTVRIDPEQDVWDVYSDARLLADNLPLIAAKKSDRKLRSKRVDGAWVCGLVADENPLYEDSNENGIDDRFELQQRGGLLAKMPPFLNGGFLPSNGGWPSEKGAPSFQATVAGQGSRFPRGP